MNMIPLTPMVNRLLLILLTVFAVLLPARLVRADMLSNSTEHLVITSGDISFNPLTLTFSGSDITLTERLSEPRTVIALGEGEVSLSLLRLIFMGQIYVDALAIHDLYISVLQDTNGMYYLLDPAIGTNELTALKQGLPFSGDKGNTEAEPGTDSKKQTKPVTQVRIPQIQLDNIDIVINSRETRQPLFSFDDIFFSLKNIYLPVTNNTDISSADIHVGINGDTSQYVSVSMRARTLPAALFLDAHVEAAHINLHTLNQFNSLSPPAAATNQIITHNLLDLIGAGTLFSSHWNRVNAAISREVGGLTSNTAFRSFFALDDRTNQSFRQYLASPAGSNIAFGSVLDVCLSNNMFQPGLFQVRFTRESAMRDSLIFTYAITNTPDVLVSQPQP